MKIERIHFPLLFCILAGLFLTSCAQFLFAVQEESVSPPNVGATSLPVRGTGEKRFEESPLSVFLTDKNGKLVAYIPGFSFEEFERINQQLLLQKEEEPLYSILKIDAIGQIVEQVARIHFQLEITTTDTPVVTIPLALKEGILLFPSSDSTDSESLETAIDYKGEGRCDLGVHPESGDYLLILRNPSVSSSVDKSLRHQLSFTLTFPVGLFGQEEQRLNLSFPNAVSSRLFLTVPTPNVTPTVAQGGILCSVQSVETEPVGTRFEVQGISKTLEISWRQQPRIAQEEKRTVLQVEDAKIFVQMNNRETVFDATLPVRSVGEPLKRFQVRLPQGAHWVPNELGLTFLSDYEVHELSQEENGAAQGTLLEIVALGSPKQDTPLSVRLKAIRRDLTGPTNNWSELAGFEVLGAERQFGSIEVDVPNDLRLNWEPVHSVREDDLADTPLRDSVDMRFVFYAQPFSLKAKLVSPQTRINVKSEYQIQVDSGQIVLTGKIAAMINGSRTNRLQMNCFDWNVDEIGPSNVVDTGGIATGLESDEGKEGMVTIPLLSRSEGLVELDIKLSRPIPTLNRNKSTLHFRLPVPIADRVEPATVVVVPADNVRLLRLEGLPGNNSGSGLTRITRNSIPAFRLPIPQRQQEPLIFRMDSNEAVFTADMTLYKQQVVAQSRSEVRLLDSQDQVTQTITYNVRYEPLDCLLLKIPQSVDESGSLKLFLDGKALDTKNLTLIDPIEPDVVNKRLSLQGTLIGKGVLTLQYSFDPKEIQRQTTTRLTVPLIVPLEMETVDQQVVAFVQNGVNVLLPDDAGEKKSWKKLEKGGETDSGLLGIYFSSGRWEHSIPLYVQLDYFDVLGTTVVERAWIQTWLTDQVRTDRALFRVLSDHENITIHLPGGLEKRLIALSFDNNRIPIQFNSEGGLQIPQKPDQRGKSHLIDIRYQMPGSPFSSTFSLELPHFDPDIWVRESYWQVVLAKNKLIIGDSPGWTSEFQWSWNGLLGGSIITLNQDTLAAWIGISEEQLLPVPQEYNQYLFSSFQPPDLSTLHVVGRTEAVLISSGVVLCLGLALIYLPPFRQTGLLFVLVVLLLSVFLYQPLPALLVFQASLLGFLITLIVALLARLFIRRELIPLVPVVKTLNPLPPLSESSNHSLVDSAGSSEPRTGRSHSASHENTSLPTHTMQHNISQPSHDLNAN
ncbi:MAG: hypothetical protein ACRC10_10445 [Thermoguttaceae bacterium]